MPVIARRCALMLAFMLSVSAIAPASQAVEATTVTIKGFHFAPTEISVAAGATVTWQNQDEEPHTVTGTGGEFRSGAMDGGDSFSFKFDKPGTYHYVCSIHPKMIGTIVVK